MSGAGDRRRAMHQAATSPVAAALEDPHRVRRKLLDGAGEGLLLGQCALGALRADPLRCWPDISGQQTGRHAITMKPPAGVAGDRFKTEIDRVDRHRVGKMPGEGDDVVDQQASRRPVGCRGGIAQGLKATSEIAQTHVETAVRHLPRVERRQPFNESVGQTALPQHKIDSRLMDRRKPSWRRADHDPARGVRLHRTDRA